MLVTMAIPGGEWTINDGYEIEPLGRYEYFEGRWFKHKQVESLALTGNDLELCLLRQKIKM